MPLTRLSQRNSRRAKSAPMTWENYPLLKVTLIAVTAFRIAYSFSRQLVPDEAYYWVWSRHLSSCYLDHPPMVAWVIWLGAYLLGSNELGVRIGAVGLAMGTIVVMMQCARQAGLGPRAQRMVGWILLASPLIQILGGIITPDTPATFFAAVALWAAVAASRRAPGTESARWWMLMGIAIGLALTSKYTSILAAASIFLAVYTSREGRKHLATIWPWLSIPVAFVVFLPVLQWNATHHWASFEFQWNHGVSDDDISWPKNLLMYVVGQFAVWTPVLAIFCAWVIWRFGRQFTTLNLSHRILLIAAILPLLFFGWSSLHHKVEANWPVLAILPAAVLAAEYVGEETTTQAFHWLRVSIIVAACATAVLHFPEITKVLPGKNVSSKWADLFGWREFGQAVDAQASGMVIDGAAVPGMSNIPGMTNAPNTTNAPGTTNAPATPVFSNFYQLAAEASFYMNGQPDVWIWLSDRPTAYDYFVDPYPDPRVFSRIIFLRKVPVDKAPPPLPAVLTDAFKKIELDNFQSFQFGKALKPKQIVIASK